MQSQLDERYKNFSKYEFDDKAAVVQEGYARRCLEQKPFIENSISSSEYESILEVGAASGYNLSLYEGKKVLGIEPSTSIFKRQYQCEVSHLYGIL